MDRSALFVDAGYLLAEGGRLTCGTRSRPAFRCDYRALTMALKEFVFEHGRSSMLRTYWYDGALQGVASPDHEQIGGFAYVKVRLGRVIQGEQKGVDALIYRDLMTLARERAIHRAYLLSGDEDLREGVVAAQDMGVQVVLLGVPTRQRTNQSAALIREADEHVVLEKSFWDPHFSKAGQEEAHAEEGMAAQADATAAAAQAAGRAYAASWLENQRAENVKKLLKRFPRIPRELDIALIVEAEKALGPLKDRQDLKHELRGAFWTAVSAGSEKPNETSIKPGASPE